MKKIKTIITALAVTLGAGLLLAPPALALDPFSQACTGKAADSVVCQNRGNAEAETQSFIRNILSLLFFVLGVICVIMIIIGGITYATSNGEQNQLTSAKNTVLYAVVGLVVALLAYAIVMFVLTQFGL